MSVIDAVECAVVLIRGMNEKERKLVLERIKDLLPQEVQQTKGQCVDGKAHKFKAVRKTDYLFSFLNKTQMVCQGCGEAKWL